MNVLIKNILRRLSKVITLDLIKYFFKKGRWHIRYHYYYLGITKKYINHKINKIHNILQSKTSLEDESTRNVIVLEKT